VRRGATSRSSAVAPIAELRGDAAENARRLPGEPPRSLADGREAIEHSAATVDALLGTGFAGEPHGPTAEAIDAIEASGSPVLAIDVPSGVDASTGVVAAPAVHATVTVTFPHGQAGTLDHARQGARWRGAHARQSGSPGARRSPRRSG